MSYRRCMLRYSPKRYWFATRPLQALLAPPLMPFPHVDKEAAAAFTCLQSGSEIFSINPAVKPPATSSKMCEYTDTSQSYTGCEEKPVKHQVDVRLYLLCDKAKPTRRHCSDSTVSLGTLLGSSRASGDCPTCTSGTVSITVSFVPCIPSIARRAVN